MAHANAHGAMAIATGNKSELGRVALYGDMAGGYAPLGDLARWKFTLLRAVQQADGKEAVTESTLTKPPSGIGSRPTR